MTTKREKALAPVAKLPGDPWARLERGLAKFDPDFMLQREKLPVQERASIDLLSLRPAATKGPPRHK